MKALEACAADLTCNLEAARNTAYDIGRQLDDIYRGADAALSEVERIHSELDRSVMGIDR